MPYSNISLSVYQSRYSSLKLYTLYRELMCLTVIIITQYMQVDSGFQDTGYIKELLYCISRDQCTVSSYKLMVYQGTSVLYPVYTGISRNQCTVFSIYWYIKELVYYIQYILVYQGASVLYPVYTSYIKKLVYCIQYILVYQETSVLYPVYTGISRDQCTISSINGWYIKKLVYCIQYILVYQGTSVLYPV